MDRKNNQAVKDSFDSLEELGRYMAEEEKRMGIISLILVFALSLLIIAMLAVACCVIINSAAPANNSIDEPIPNIPATDSPAPAYERPTAEPTVTATAEATAYPSDTPDWGSPTAEPDDTAEPSDTP